MANKMVATIKSLTSGVGDLTKNVNELFKALDKVNTVATKSLQNAVGTVGTVGGHYNLTQGSNRPGTGADGARFNTMAMNAIQQNGNMLAGAMGGFSTSNMAMGGMFGNTAAARAGGVQGVANVISGSLSTIPGLSDTMTRTYGYYQAGLKAPGINRNQLERATFSAMRGGVSSVGSDAQAAAYLASIGYTPGSANYLQAMGQVGGAYKYLGMSNMSAAQAIGGFQTGPMAANLFQYGITTTGANGKEKNPGQIARELMNYMTGGAKVSAEDIRKSYQRGALGANLSTMGFSADQQSILYQSMIDIAGGGTGDLATAKPVKGNENTFLTAQGRINAAQTKLMTDAEQSMIKGFENAADTVEAFSRVVDHAAGALGRAVGYTQGVGGSKTTKGGMKTLGGVAQIAGALLTATGVGAEVGIPLMLAGTVASNLGGGGSTSGYGASFGVANRHRRGGGSPVAGASVGAGYGATDNSGIWSGTNNKHTGTDFAVPIGTPVTSAFDGTVSQVDLNADYGTSIMIDNSDGTQSIYAHLSEKAVKVGDQIKQGQRIGKSGQSGNAAGPHLHYELRDAKNHPINPNSSLGSSPGIFGDYASTLSTGSELFGSDTSSSNLTSSGGILGTGEQQAWAKDFLTRLGKPTTDTNIKAMTTWMAWEGGHWKNTAHYNPLNTTLDAAGASSINKVGVKSYQDYEQGMKATLDTIKVNKYGYDAILNALSSGNDYQGVVSAVNSSKWGTHIKGGGSTGYGASVHSPSMSSGSKTVNVTLKIERASEQEAMNFAKQVKFYLEQDTETKMIGRS
jgi:hypothetical protein